MLADKHRETIEAILAKYPPAQRRSAVMPLLHLAQQERGHVAPEDLEEIAALLGISPTQVGSLVGFYSLYYDRPGGKYRLQICTDLPCALRGAQAFAQALCDRLGIEIGGTTADGLISVEAVMCLAACDRAPVFQVQDPNGLHYHEDQTVDSALQFVEALRKGIGRG
ncbi:MAG TPA: NAD(P)H-dependent oxidoreductase subunit E [Anaerolineales bacterium]|nr:NAD(P)H-dependent oxidoreductase subunit E [Anaerolineales bacterium]